MFLLVRLYLRLRPATQWGGVALRAALARRRAARAARDAAAFEAACARAIAEARRHTVQPAD